MAGSMKRPPREFDPNMIPELFDYPHRYCHYYVQEFLQGKGRTGQEPNFNQDLTNAVHKDIQVLMNRFQQYRSGLQTVRKAFVSLDTVMLFFEKFEIFANTSLGRSYDWPEFLNYVNVISKWINYYVTMKNDYVKPLDYLMEWPGTGQYLKLIIDIEEAKPRSAQRLYIDIDTSGPPDKTMAENVVANCKVAYELYYEVLGYHIRQFQNMTRWLSPKCLTQIYREYEKMQVAYNDRRWTLTENLVSQISADQWEASLMIAKNKFKYTVEDASPQDIEWDSDENEVHRVEARDDGAPLFQPPTPDWNEVKEIGLENRTPPREIHSKRRLDALGISAKNKPSAGVKRRRPELASTSFSPAGRFDLREDRKRVNELLSFRRNKLYKKDFDVSKMQRDFTAALDAAENSPDAKDSSTPVKTDGNFDLNEAAKRSMQAVRDAFEYRYDRKTIDNQHKLMIGVVFKVYDHALKVLRPFYLWAKDGEGNRYGYSQEAMSKAMKATLDWIQVLESEKNELPKTKRLRYVIGGVPELYDTIALYSFKFLVEL